MMFGVNKDNFIAAFKKQAEFSRKNPSTILNAIDKDMSWFDVKKYIPDWCGEILNALLESAKSTDKGHITELMGEYISGKMEIDEFCSVLDMITDSTPLQSKKQHDKNDGIYIILRAKNVAPGNEKAIIFMLLNENITEEIKKQKVYASHYNQAIPFSFPIEPYFITSDFILNENDRNDFSLLYKNYKLKSVPSFEKLPALLKDAFLKNNRKGIKNYFLMITKDGDLNFAIKSFNKNENEVILLSEKFNADDYLG